jgi:hypothetical protein
MFQPIIRSIYNGPCFDGRLTGLEGRFFFFCVQTLCILKSAVIYGSSTCKSLSFRYFGLLLCGVAEQVAAKYPVGFSFHLPEPRLASLSHPTYGRCQVSPYFPRVIFYQHKSLGHCYLTKDFLFRPVGSGRWFWFWLCLVLLSGFAFHIHTHTTLALPMWGPCRHNAFQYVIYHKVPERLALIQ